MPSLPAIPIYCTMSLGIFKLFLEVLKILNLKSTDIREITLSPNRQIIKLRISKVSNEVEIAMPWLIDALNDLKQNFPRSCIGPCHPFLLYQFIVQCHHIKQYYNN
jgi:hypothetical protein